MQYQDPDSSRKARDLDSSSEEKASTVESTPPREKVLPVVECANGHVPVKMINYRISKGIGYWFQCPQCYAKKLLTDTGIIDEKAGLDQEARYREVKEENKKKDLARLDENIRNRIAGAKRIQSGLVVFTGLEAAWYLSTIFFMWYIPVIFALLLFPAFVATLVHFRSLIRRVEKSFFVHDEETLAPYKSLKNNVYSRIVIASFCFMVVSATPFFFSPPFKNWHKLPAAAFVLLFLSGIVLPFLPKPEKNNAG